MYAERVMLETDQDGHLTQVPQLPPHAKIEAIFLVIDHVKPTKRRPPEALRGTAIEHGDIIAPAFAETDWDPAL
jgi:hypothetical protein